MGSASRCGGPQASFRSRSTTSGQTTTTATSADRIPASSTPDEVEALEATLSLQIQRLRGLFARPCWRWLRPVACFVPRLSRMSRWSMSRRWMPFRLNCARRPQRAGLSCARCLPVMVRATPPRADAGPGVAGRWLGPALVVVHGHDETNAVSSTKARHRSVCAVYAPRAAKRYLQIDPAHAIARPATRARRHRASAPLRPATPEGVGEPRPSAPPRSAPKTRNSTQAAPAPAVHDDARQKPRSCGSGLRRLRASEW